DGESAWCQAIYPVGVRRLRVVLLAWPLSLPLEVSRLADPLAQGVRVSTSRRPSSTMPFNTRRTDTARAAYFQVSPMDYELMVGNYRNLAEVHDSDSCCESPSYHQR